MEGFGVVGWGQPGYWSRKISPGLKQKLRQEMMSLSLPNSSFFQWIPHSSQICSETGQWKLSITENGKERASTILPGGITGDSGPKSTWLLPPSWPLGKEVVRQSGETQLFFADNFIDAYMVFRSKSTTSPPLQLFSHSPHTFPVNFMCSLFRHPEPT